MYGKKTNPRKTVPKHGKAGTPGKAVSQFIEGAQDVAPTQQGAEPSSKKHKIVLRSQQGIQLQ